MRLSLVSAWNDSGGGFLHRLLDGHPDVRVWPFELQLGNGGHDDDYSRLIGAKYRWPVKRDSPDAFFDSISDEELKSVLADPKNAKHANFPVPINLAAWKDAFLEKSMGAHDRAALITAYIASFFSLAGETSGRVILGHCPNIVIDFTDVWNDFPNAKIVHVVRDPVAGFADFRGRHPEFAATAYAERWSAVNGAAARARARHPAAVLLVCFASLIEARESTMRAVAAHLGIGFDPALLRPSWRGVALDESAMGPFGGVPQIGKAREAQLQASVASDEKQALMAGTDVARSALENI